MLTKRLSGEHVTLFSFYFFVESVADVGVFIDDHSSANCDRMIIFAIDLCLVCLVIFTEFSCSVCLVYRICSVVLHVRSLLSKLVSSHALAAVKLAHNLDILLFVTATLQPCTGRMCFVVH